MSGGGTGAGTEVGGSGGATPTGGSGGTIVGGGTGGGVVGGTGGTGGIVIGGAGGILGGAGGSGGIVGGAGGTGGIVVGGAGGTGGGIVGGAGGSGGTLPVTLGKCTGTTTSSTSGWATCSGPLGITFYHRPSSGTCPIQPPSPSPTCTDDCSTLPYGHCWTSGYWAIPECIPGCVTDADCGADEICFCEGPNGRCIPSTCKVDSDCGPNAFCSTYKGPSTPSCDFWIQGAACQEVDDQCTGADCNCAMVGDHRECVQGIGGCGRPFLVNDLERRAEPASRDDWSWPDEPRPKLDGLDASLRARLAAHWTAAGLMEHASIAAFARFTLELLALGAPAELVADSIRATADETRHATLCFSLAGAYGPKPIGPDRLSVSDCLTTSTLVSVVRTVLLEGCIGETVAAAEASELARAAEDPTVRRALEQIAKDESRHAALAYRFVRWALAQGDAEVLGTIRAILDAELARAASDCDEPTESDESDLLALGLPTDGFRKALRRETLKQVVLPCVTSLLSSVQRSSQSEARNFSTSSCSPITSSVSPA